VQENRQISSRSSAANRGGPLLGALDLGTNNCRLLIARPAGPDGFHVVDSFSRIVRLGEGVGASGLLSAAAIERTVAALKICAARIAKHKVRHVMAVATQAARLAANTDVLVKRVRAETGLELAVITNEQEADLAALGCAPLIGPKHAGALIFDPADEHLLGTSGTVTTLAAIDMKLARYNRSKVDASWHQTANLLAVVERLARLDLAGLAKIGPIGSERADLMLAGSAIFSAICALWPSPMLRVADRGLREGMLRRMQQDLK